MKTLARFDCDINALARELLVDADLIKRKVALDIYARLQSKTPVDTGRARAGWSVSTAGASYYNKVTREAPAGWKKGDSPYYPLPKAPVISPGAPVIYIYNNVDYIGMLNDGKSTQAPAMFVETTVDEVMGGLSA